jgi:hypothetical protein
MSEVKLGPKTDFERIIVMACANHQFMEELLKESDPDDGPDFVDRIMALGLMLSSTEKILLRNLTYEQLTPHRWEAVKNYTKTDLAFYSALADTLLSGQPVASLEPMIPKPENYTQTRGLSAHR